MDERDDIQIADTETYISEKDQQYSHQALVMKVMGRCVEASSKEMRSGYYNKKTDKYGSENLFYVEDTRKHFIECVRTAQMFMECDMDKEAEDKTKEVEQQLRKTFIEYCKREKTDWDSANITLKKQRWSVGIYYRAGYLHPELQYAQEFINEQVIAYRDIFKELNKLTSRLDFYKAEEFEA